MMKIKASILISFMIYAISIAGFAQIDHTLLNPPVEIILPDSTGSNYYNVDLDNNGSDDFYLNVELFFTNEFTAHSVDSYRSDIIAYDTNMVDIGPLSNGDQISSSNTYSIKGLIYGWIPEFGGRDGSWAHENPDPENSAYIGLKLAKNGSIYYGWIELKSDGKSITILGYAVHTVANQSINAGQY